MDFPQFLTIPATGDKIPIVAFGSGTRWQIKKKGENGGPEHSKGVVDKDLVEMLKSAVNHGFIHLDTAEIYTTRRDVGAALKEIEMPREKLWITDKYHPGSEDREGNPRGPYDSLKEGLELMGTDYVDMYLLHTANFTDDGFPFEKAWPEMERLYEEGLAKNIGVSNFDVANLKRIIKTAKYKPAVCQTEFHAYLQDQSTGIRQYLKDHHILMEAYAPLSPLTRDKDGPLKELLPKLSKKYGRSATQILLKWAHQQGIVTVTTTSKESRMDDIMNMFDFQLRPEDIQLISDTGNTHFYRAFKIPPLPTYDTELKIQRGIAN
ncbi:hypothetical protein FOA43_004071 [Brettanomyces nanus]|uniref:NADP-dependent oxidoreductase domain-containing protein n=1 Tax=Eeniella nana TaxID=13502 RepID=A0A875RX41_EENNA|nr:uncharacterized protein FOA43_004071 [Brettanomyces nanus]QPG76677.1 hypothetical protein FOA43_004071 [Brettanomyces nanus]